MRYLPVALLTLTCLQLSAQQFGGNPSSLKWQQINTDTVRVIFPAGLGHAGERVANIVTYLNRYNRLSIGPLQKKVNIVLQNQTMESNGYVALGPFRSEFFLAPPPTSYNLGSLNWVEQLSLHEYRHVLQNMNFRQGASKVFSWLGGEMGQAAATNIAVPNWFWEGDAVTMETALSQQGRGRLPAFFDGFRALALAQKDYSYMKIRNGSYRDYTPDHYPLGYLMSVYGREHYGTTFWKEVTTDAVRFRGVFYPMSRSMKKRTGMNVTGFYHAAMQHYDSIWTRYAQRPEITPAQPLLPAPKVFTNYKYLYPAGTPDEYVLLKASWNTVPGFYLLKADGSATLLTRPGIVFDDYFSYRNNRIVWAAARFDARWGWKDLSAIRIYDRTTGRTATVPGKGKYYAPDINTAGTKVIAVSATPDMQYSLRLINTATGEVEKILPNPDNYYYTNPRFNTAEDAVISAVRNAKGEMALVSQSLATGAITPLSGFSYQIIGAPVIAGDTLYFTSGVKDVNNVYAMTLSGRKTWQVTDRPNSALFMAPSANGLVFSEFTAGGYQLLTTAFTAPWKEADITRAQQGSWLHPDLKEGGNILDKVPADSLPVKPYRKTTGFFNFHSWVPSFNDPEYSISLLGNNILNTTSTSVGYTYNRNEGTSTVGANFTYGAWFPWLGTGFDYTINKNALLKGKRYYWNQLSWHAGFTIPLQLSSGMYSRSLSLSSNYYIQKLYSDQLRFRVNPQQYSSSSLVFNNQRIRATQHILSHFGQYLALQYNHSIGAQKGEQLYGRFDLNLPGLAKSHSLQLQAAYQQRDTLGNYSFTDRFVYARGYNTPFYNRIYKVGANYHFPLWYPDWGFAHLLYFTRIRANAFYDYSSAHNYLVKRDNLYRSTGGELYFDTKIGNVIPFTFGMRVSYLVDPDPADNAKTRVEFIIPIQQLFAY